MSDPIKVRVTAEDLSVEEPDKAIIDSIELVNALVVEPADTWQMVAADLGRAVSTERIRVTDDGRIVIQDQEVFNKFKDIVAGPIPGAGANLVGCHNLRCTLEQ